MAVRAADPGFLILACSSARFYYSWRTLAATDKAVGIRPQLVGGSAEVSLSDSARSLHAHAEALRLVAPHFRKFLQAFADRAQALQDDYCSTCEEVCQEPARTPAPVHVTGSTAGVA